MIMFSIDVGGVTPGSMPPFSNSLNMIDKCSFRVVKSYMKYIQDISEEAVRDLLKKMP